MQWLLIAVGGAVGAVARYAVSGWVQPRFLSTFPWGTLTVNVVGCLLMGLLFPILTARMQDAYRMMILVGFLGALTTWSTFGYETIALLNDGDFRAAGLNVLVTNLACLSSVWLGYRVAERLVTS